MQLSVLCFIREHLLIPEYSHAARAIAVYEFWALRLEFADLKEGTVAGLGTWVKDGNRAVTTGKALIVLDAHCGGRKVYPSFAWEGKTRLQDGPL
jgi:hypothetical protein